MTMEIMTVLWRWRSKAVTPRDRCARCLPVIRCLCHVICLRVASCHVIIRIASTCFQNLHPPGFPQFRPLSVLSPDTLARARGTSGIYFLEVAGKCSWNGMRVGVRYCFVGSRSHAKFHRIRSPFDAPTDNYSDNIAGLTSDVFGLRKQSSGLSSLLSA